MPNVFEGYAPVNNLALYYREIGEGPPIVILHGGPDFDHTYLLPDMDRLADAYHLIYYDQRGRGLSVGDDSTSDIRIETEMQDLEDLQNHLHLEKVALLGHSWGGQLALSYAMSRPERVSTIILMNTCIATHQDFMDVREERARRIAIHEDKLNALQASPEYAAGDPHVVADYYRTIFSTTIKRADDVDKLNISLPNYTESGVLRARQIEERLYGETWLSPDFNIVDELKQIAIPTLIIHGDYDFIPHEIAERMAEIIPNAKLALIKDCGHFAYLEAPDQVRQAIINFLVAGT